MANAVPLAMRIGSEPSIDKISIARILRHDGQTVANRYAGAICRPPRSLKCGPLLLGRFRRIHRNARSTVGQHLSNGLRPYLILNNIRDAFGSQGFEIDVIRPERRSVKGREAFISPCQTRKDAACRKPGDAKRHQTSGFSVENKPGNL
jgi:hypothetical protein